MNAWLRWVCVAGVLALVSAAAASPDKSDDKNSPLWLLNEAVLDWCDAQAGEFFLPEIGAPACATWEGSYRVGSPAVVYMGTLKGMFGAAMAPDVAWWWKLRTGDTRSWEPGVLWYVGPNDNPKELCAASEGKLCQCPAAHAALNNPARVPVVLIGPGAAVCEAGR